MTRVYARLLFVCAILLFGGCHSVEDPDRGATAMLAAQRGVSEMLPALVRSDPYYRLGFSENDDLRRMVVGEGFPVVSVKLPQLRDFRPQTSVASIVGESHDVIFPIVAPMSPGASALLPISVRSSVTVSKSKNGEWEATSYGDVDLVRSLVEARSRMIAMHGVQMSSFLLVESPALHLRLLGMRKGAELLLVPLRDDSRFQFKAGVPLAAGKAYLAMQPAAAAFRKIPD